MRGNQLADCAFEDLSVAARHDVLVGAVHFSIQVHIALHRDGYVLYVTVLSLEG